MDMGSGSFMQLMSGEDDFEVQSLSMSDEVVGTQCSTGKAQKRAGNYTHQEDIQLCKSWENITTDPVVGNEQPGKAYWKRIADNFHANKDFESDRNANSLEHRWSAIQKECSKFQGFYEQIECRHPSGIPYKEHILEAQTLFSSKEPENKPFQFLHCWLKVRNYEKFVALSSNKRPKTSKAVTPSEEGVQENNETCKIPTAESSQARPIGRKQAKEKSKSSGDAELYKEASKELVSVKKMEGKAKEEQWKETMILQERKIALEELKFMWEQEQKIMFCDVAELEPDVRTYVLTMRAQIAAQKVASLKGGSGGFEGFGSPSGGGADAFSGI